VCLFAVRRWVDAEWPPQMWVIAICIVRSGSFRVVFAGSPPTLSARFNYCALGGASTSLRKRCARSNKLRCMFDIRSLIGVQLLYPVCLGLSALDDGTAVPCILHYARLARWQCRRCKYCSLRLFQPWCLRQESVFLILCLAQPGGYHVVGLRHNMCNATELI